MVKQMQAFQTGGPLVQARNFAVMTGVNAGLAVAVRRWGKGKVDETYGTCVTPNGAKNASSAIAWGCKHVMHVFALLSSCVWLAL